MVDLSAPSTPGARPVGVLTVEQKLFTGQIFVEEDRTGVGALKRVKDESCNYRSRKGLSGGGQGPPFPLRRVSVIKASGRLGWLFSEISIKEIL